MNDTTLKQDMLQCAQSALARLEAGQSLTREECRQAIDGLDAIERDAAPSPSGAVRGDSVDLDALLQNFGEYAKESQQHLQELLATVSAGKVPDQADIEALRTAIDAMREHYASIYQVALSQLQPDELPASGAGAEELVEAVRNSRAALLRRELDEIRQCLLRFLAVSSPVALYQEALAPYQAEAKTLLETLSTDGTMDLDAAREGVEGPTAFFAEMARENNGTNDGTAADSIARYYPIDVLKGLWKQKYCVLSDPPEEAAPAPVQPAREEPPEAEAPVETCSAFAKALRDSGALAWKNIPFVQPNWEVSQNEGKKISASIFKNELKDGPTTASMLILCDIAKKHYLDPRILIEGYQGQGREKAVRQALSFLFQKGYLLRYTLPPAKEVYGASARLKKALSYQDGSKFVHTRQMAAQDWDEFDRERPASVAARIAFATLFADRMSRASREGVHIRLGQPIFFQDAFLARIERDVPSGGNELIAGAFWTGTEECDRFLERVRLAAVTPDGVDSITVAGVDLPCAKALAETLAKALHDVRPEAVRCLYSLSEDACYSYPDVTPLEEPPRQTGGTEPERAGSEGTDEIPAAAGPEGADETPTVEQPREHAAPPQTGEVPSAPRPSAMAPWSAIQENACQMIVDGQCYAASAYLKAMGRTSPDAAQLYTQLAYALNDPMGRCTYAAENVFPLMERQSPFSDALVIASALRVFFSNQVRYDHSIKSFYDAIRENTLLTRSPALSGVLYSLMEFKESHKKGADAYAAYRARSQTELERETARLRQEARDFYENFVVGRKKENCSQKRFLNTKRLMFSTNSDLGQYIKAVSDGDREIQPLIRSFLLEHFYKEDQVLSPDTISPDRLWAYIETFWEMAGEDLAIRRRDPLVSRLRSNITVETTKAVRLLARWDQLLEQSGEHAEDDGTNAYQKLKGPLQDGLRSAIEELDACADTSPLEERAGLAVVVRSLEELLHCVDGTFREESRPYLYAPFLLTDDVILDESFLPDLELRGLTMPSMLPETRILAHARRVKGSGMDLSSRLRELLAERGDDLGSAKLIVEYLSAMDPALDLTVERENIESSEGNVRMTAGEHRKDLIGELELAQSYGQMDNSEENQKEAILQTVDEWYEWAAESSNYGFFQKVMDAFLREIKETAKVREADLLAQLDRFQSETIPGLSAEAKAARASKIGEMIADQNYTVAEDLLARASVIEDLHEEPIEEDHLKGFLENYEDYYRPVSKRGESFSSLVSSRTRNKEERGAKRLADNWLPGGSDLGRERLTNLLNSLGFDIAMVKPLEPVKHRYENFAVLTKSTIHGQRDHYTHPIAAFGSGAAREGFRVVCINGAYDADGLIDIMKQIGNAKHTLILIDHALSLGERRRLARRSKTSLGDKLFGVIDRTVMMFLIRHYDETKIDRMLIALIAPFGYYQPYVWESSNVMPPEIFMGRKKELERIESPTGVNIVYGGRQLGKSALLKKAKEDVDRNENDDRAVYIEIKGKDYAAAARKIGHELYDQAVLSENIDTSDWDELARAVKRRLQSETEEKIPYLLLLLDEADAFIESCEAVNYKPFDALKEIQSIGAGRFKFVIAGLRNIIRFKRDAALSNNSVLTHLQPMTVKPFHTAEARELMEVPLHYLGLRFPKENRSLVALILASTNYFPGLIQMYCAKLLEAMRSQDYAGYDEANTPIYEISEDHIKKVLADPEFTQQIREKYIITLKHDEDNYYYLIALLMAYLYHDRGCSSGYSASDIKESGEALSIAKIAALDTAKLNAFLEELKELNVLRSTDETHYLFTRFTFFQMMGTSAEVEDKLMEYMEG